MIDGQKKPVAARDGLLNVDAPSLDADGQAVNETLAPVNIDDEPKAAKANGNVVNNKAMKEPVTVLSCLTRLSKHSTQRISIPTLTKQKTPTILTTEISTTKTGKA